MLFNKITTSMALTFALFFYRYNFKQKMVEITPKIVPGDILLLHWTKVWDSPMREDVRLTGCRGKNFTKFCHFTSDRRYILKANAVIFFFPSTWWFDLPLIEKQPGQIYVFDSSEPPTKFQNHFNSFIDYNVRENFETI